MNNDLEKLIIIVFPYLDYATGDQRQGPVSEIENTSWSIVGNAGLILLVSTLTDYMVGKEKKTETMSLWQG